MSSTQFDRVIDYSTHVSILPKKYYYTFRIWCTEEAKKQLLFFSYGMWYEHKQQPARETTTASVRWKLAVKAKETLTGVRSFAWYRAVFWCFRSFFSTFLLHGSLGIQAAARQCWRWRQGNTEECDFSSAKKALLIVLGWPKFAVVLLLFSQIHNQQSTVQWEKRKLLTGFWSLNFFSLSLWTWTSQFDAARNLRKTEN